MAPPIPSGKWSWWHESCLNCKTSSQEGRHKHEAKGLCQFCYKKEQSKKRIEEKIAKGIKTYPRIKFKNEYQRVKNDPVKLQKYYEASRRSRKREWYKRHLLTRFARQKYKRFIKAWFEGEQVDYGKLGVGVTMNMEYGGKGYLIVTPLQPKHLRNHHLEVFRIEFERYMKKRSYPLDNQIRETTIEVKHSERSY